MKNKERTQVVVDETTIYEIDLECLGCKEANVQKLPPAVKEKRAPQTNPSDKETK